MAHSGGGSPRSGRHPPRIARATSGCFRRRDYEEVPRSRPAANGIHFSQVTRSVSEGQVTRCVNEGMAGHGRCRPPSLTRRVTNVSAIGPAARDDRDNRVNRDNRKSRHNRQTVRSFRRNRHEVTNASVPTGESARDSRGSCVPILPEIRLHTDSNMAAVPSKRSDTIQNGDIRQHVPSFPETCVMFATRDALIGERCATDTFETIPTDLLIVMTTIGRASQPDRTGN